MGFAPILEVPASVINTSPLVPKAEPHATLIGHWEEHSVRLPDGSSFLTGVEKTNPWWHVEGQWFNEKARECVIGTKLAKKLGVELGASLYVARAGLVLPTANNRSLALRVSGILATGGVEDDAIIAPLTLAQWLGDKTGQYRKLYVSALTKPEAQIELLRSNGFFPSVDTIIPDDLPPAVELEADAVHRQQQAQGAILSLPPVGLGQREGEVSKVFKDSFRSIVLDGADIRATLDQQARVLQGILDELKVPCWAPDPVADVCGVG
jgi:hypothetical protein